MTTRVDQLNRLINSHNLQAAAARQRVLQYESNAIEECQRSVPSISSSTVTLGRLTADAQNLHSLFTRLKGVAFSLGNVPRQQDILEKRLKHLGQAIDQAHVCNEKVEKAEMLLQSGKTFEAIQELKEASSAWSSWDVVLMERHTRVLNASVRMAQSLLSEAERKSDIGDTEKWAVALADANLEKEGAAAYMRAVRMRLRKLQDADIGEVLDAYDELLRTKKPVLLDHFGESRCDSVIAALYEMLNDYVAPRLDAALSRCDAIVGRKRDGEDLKSGVTPLVEVVSIIVRLVSFDMSASKDGFTRDSGLRERIQSAVSRYIPLEQHFLKLSIQVAFSGDEVSTDDYESSVVEDFFFVTFKSLRRSLTVRDVTAFSTVLNSALVLIAVDLAKYLQKSIRLSKVPYMQMTNAWQQLAKFDLKSLINSSSHSGAASSFIHSMNNAKAAIDNCDKLKLRLADIIHNTYDTEPDQGSVFIACLEGISGSRDVLRGVYEETIHELVEYYMGWTNECMESFYGVDLNMTVDSYAQNEKNGSCAAVVSQILKVICAHLSEYCDEWVTFDVIGNLQSNTRSTIETWLLEPVDPITTSGALFLDTEIRHLVNAFTKCSEPNSTRTVFAKLLEVAEILTFETHDELNEFWGVTSGPLHLSVDEVQQITRRRHVI